MKKLLALVLTAMMLVASLALVACGENVEVSEIKIVAATTEYTAGKKFTLDYTVVPEEAKEDVKVNWEISDARRLSYEKGEFTAHTFGTVKVKATVKGSDASDEIELKINVPSGFKEYSDNGFQLAYPSNWTSTQLGLIQTWFAADNSTNMNVATEPLNATYFKASASDFQSTLTTQLRLLGYTVKFLKPTKLQKDTSLGVKRLRLDYFYSATVSGETLTFYQTQIVMNNESENLSCVLTVTHLEENFTDSAELLQEQIIDQFIIK